MTDIKPTNPNDLRDFLQGFFLDWMNNYITTQKMASDYGITQSLCRDLIRNGRRIHEERVEAYVYKREGEL